MPDKNIKTPVRNTTFRAGVKFLYFIKALRRFYKTQFSLRTSLLINYIQIIDFKPVRVPLFFEFGRGV